MDPIIKTILILLGWILLTFIILSIADDRGGRSFAILVYGFYLMPIVGIIAYALFLITDKNSWMRNNLILSIAFGVLLFLWLLGIGFYIYNLLQ